MDARDRLSARIQALGDEVYVRRDEVAVASLPEEALALGFTGLVLGAPRAVELKGADGLPALLLTARSAARSADVDWRANAIVVAADTESGEVYAGEAFRADPEKSPGPPPSRGRDPARAPAPAVDPLLAQLGAGNTAGTVWLDFARLLTLPQESRRWAMRVIYFDEVSNPAVVEARGSAASPAMSQDEARALVARMRAAPHREGLPRYFRSAETPQLPSTGVAAVLGVPGTKAGVLSIPLHGVMKVEASPRSLVQPVAGTPADGTRPPAAVLRAMVLIVTKDRNMPARIPLQVPVWADKPLKAGEVIEGVFSIDLADALPKGGAGAGPHQVYLVAGRYLAGPLKVQLNATK